MPCQWVPPLPIQKQPRSVVNPDSSPHFFVCAAPAVGSVAPDFTLPSNTGKDIGLQDLLKKAKHTVLYFYPGGAGLAFRHMNIFSNPKIRCPPWFQASCWIFFHAYAIAYGSFPHICFNSLHAGLFTL